MDDITKSSTEPVASIPGDEDANTIKRVALLMFQKSQEALNDLRQQVEDTLVVAKTDVDSEGGITDYHFKTGAIHRLLAKAREGDGPETQEAKMIYAALAEADDARSNTRQQIVRRLVDAVYRSMELCEDDQWWLNRLKAEARVKVILERAKEPVASTPECVKCDELNQVAQMALEQFEFTYGKRSRGWDAAYLMERLRSVLSKRPDEGENDRTM